MMSRIDAHAMAKNTLGRDFSVQKCLTIIFISGIHIFGSNDFLNFLEVISFNCFDQIFAAFGCAGNN